MYGLILSLALVSTAPSCSWDHPGANPYNHGDPAVGLDDYAMPAAIRHKLQTRIRHHQFDEIADIRRDSITGQSAEYSDMRDMHYGKNTVCRGPVDRSHWSSKKLERGLVYCEQDVCVIIPTVCNNVSLITRKQEDGPINISPAAGPQSGSALLLPFTLGSEESSPGEVSLGNFTLPGPIASNSPVPATPDGGAGGPEPFPSTPSWWPPDDGGPLIGGPPSKGPPSTPPPVPPVPPIIVPPGPPVVPPVTPPVVPPVIPPVSPIPEPSTFWMCIAGLMGMLYVRRR